MAKMRGIKPETFTDDKVLQLSPLARWLFVGMWTEACDNGHVEDNLVQIKIRLLPMDDCKVADLMGELLDTGQVVRGDGYLKVVNLPQHQNIDKRYLRLCEWCRHDGSVVFTDDDRPSRPSRAQGGHTVPAPGAQGGHDVEVKGSEVKGSEGEGRGRKRPARTIPENWKPTTKHQEYANERGVDLSSEAFRFRNHALSVDRRVVNWNAAFTNWLSKAKPERTAARGQQPEGW